jgi:hypothetical protein
MTHVISRSVRPCNLATAVGRSLMEVLTWSEFVTGKLDAALVAQFTGDIPQNVNFRSRPKWRAYFWNDALKTAPAEEAFNAAVTIARSRRGVEFRAGAAMSLERLWRD